jgi:hypothetical protein
MGCSRGGQSITVITVITVSSPQAASTLLQKRNSSRFPRRRKVGVVVSS